MTLSDLLHIVSSVNPITIKNGGLQDLRLSLVFDQFHYITISSPFGSSTS